MRLLILFLLLSSCFSVGAQDFLSGRWKGNFTRSSMTQPEALIVDLQISSDSIVSGSSHLYYLFEEYEHYTIKGVYHKADSSIYFYEDSTLSIHLAEGVDNCLGNYTMRLRIRDSMMRLEGRWQVNAGDNPGCPMVGVWLSKKAPPPPKPELPEAKDKNLDRPTVTQSLIEVSEGERENIKIEVLDNAQIDNDAVSIYVNGENVVRKQVLKREPIVFYVTLSKTTPLARVVMAAESMGSVPPCTALMNVTVGGKVHQASLSSNMGNSGSLELFLKE